MDTMGLLNVMYWNSTALVEIAEKHQVWYDTVIKQNNKWYTPLMDYYLKFFNYCISHEDVLNAEYNKDKNEVSMILKSRIHGSTISEICSVLNCHHMDFNILAESVWDDDSSWLGNRLILTFSV